MEIDTSTMPPPGIELSYPNKSLAVGDCVIVEIVILKNGTSMQMLLVMNF